MDFDDAKENIQPLATGRNVSILQATLRVESVQELQAQRRELEDAIHNYSGDDPLEAWYEYIIWIEQSFPSGGKESGLEEVLTKCLTHFENESRYHQDRRLIKLYIKFIDMHKDPTECYQQLFNAGIGTMVADLYISWAYCYDLCGNYRKADEIFRRGISCRAQPLEDLQESHQHFGFIVSQRLLYQHDANETELANQQLHERRLALSSLRTHRKKVGSIRTGSAVKSYVPGTVQIDGVNRSTRGCNVQVSVFSDENLNPNMDLPTPVYEREPEDEKKSVIRSILDLTRDQENQKEPGPWNKVHDKKKGKLFTKNTTTNLGFSILEDSNPNENENRVNTKEIIIKKPFKPFPNFVPVNRPQPEWLTPVTIENEAVPLSYPQYNKCKLYPRPNMEFQLEELLAYNWFRKHGIKNKFTQERDEVWQDNNESIQPMRRYPNFAKKSRAQKLDSLDTFYAPEKRDGMEVVDEIYNTIEKQEMQFEEILFKRWKNGERKLRYDANDTVIIATEMEETFCMPQDEEPANRRKSFFPSRKSIFKKIAPKLPLNDEVTVENKVVSADVKNAVAISNLKTEKPLLSSIQSMKIYEDNIPSTSKAAVTISKDVQISLQDKPEEIATADSQNYFQFKTPAVPATNLKTKIPFEVYEEPAIERLNVQSIPETIGFFDADETCSTQVFNCFIKAQSVSTPMAPQKVAPRMFGTILKERSEPEPEPEPVLDIIAPTLIESSVETTSITTPPSTATTFSPLEPKQLSTILETSEHGTTKSISSPENETDPKTSTGRLLTTQHITNLETVKEQSYEVSSKIDPILCNTLPKNVDNEMIDSIQTEDVGQQVATVATPAAPRQYGINFAIFEDPTEVAVTATTKQFGNFSRLEEREDTASGLAMCAVKFQEDKTETVPRMMCTSKQSVKYQEDKTETLHKISMPLERHSLSKIPPINVPEKMDDTLNFLTAKRKVISQEEKPDAPLKLCAPLEDHSLYKFSVDMPEKMDDTFNFLSQTTPKASKSINNKTSLISTTELLGFDVENSPIVGPSAPKFKCTYNTPELREKMSFLRQCKDTDVHKSKSKIIVDDGSFIAATQPSFNKSAILKKSFLSDFSIIAETQPTNSKIVSSNNEDSFVKDSQPTLGSSKFRQQVAKPIMRSVLRESFELGDFSFVMDSQPTKNTEAKWKQNDIKLKSTDIADQNEQREHILTESFMKDFSEPAINIANNSIGLKFMAEKSICNLSKLKLDENLEVIKTPKICTKKDGEEPLLVEASTQGNKTKDIVDDNFLKPAFAYGSEKINVVNEVIGKPEDQFEYNAETAQFATNVSMIKNSTLLLPVTPKRQTLFQDKSLHIKEERQSQDENLFNTTNEFKPPNLPISVATSQACKSLAPKSSKLSFLTAGGKITDPIANISELNTSLRYSIDLSPNELAALQKANMQNSISKYGSTSFGIEFKTPAPVNPIEKSQSKTHQNKLPETMDHTSGDDVDDNEMSIYVKNTPKTPIYERHVWNTSVDEVEDNSNQFVHPENDFNQTLQIIKETCLDENVNPFNTDLINAFLEKVDFINYIEALPECELVGRVKQIHKDAIVKVNNVQFKVLKLVGEGAYGAVFCATATKSGKKYVLKQERPTNYWEYYICLELRSRLPVEELCSAFMTIDYALIGNNAGILISQFSSYGSLIAVCNKIKRVTNKNVDEYVVMYLTCQLLDMMDHLHASEIVHADIKADNFLLMEKLSYDGSTMSLKLIDFGVSIDMRLFKKGQTFTYAHTDNAMKCVEMRENRPWTYQLDLYGLAGVIHVLLFGKYMDVEKNASRFWMHKTYVPRYINKSLWETIFKSLLNIPNCATSSMPNLQNLRQLLKEEIAEKENAVIKKIFDFNRALDS